VGRGWFLGGVAQPPEPLFYTEPLRVGGETHRCLQVGGQRGPPGLLVSVVSVHRAGAPSPPRSSGVCDNPGAPVVASHASRARGPRRGYFTPRLFPCPTPRPQPFVARPSGSLRTV